MASGSGAAWLAHLVWDQRVAGSNPVSPTTSFRFYSFRFFLSRIGFRVRIKKFFLVIILLALTSNTCPRAFGKGRPPRFYLYGSIFGDPFPSVPGINLGYQPKKFIRFFGGYGAFGYAGLRSKEMAAGIKIIFPLHQVKPILGFAYGSVRNWDNSRIWLKFPGRRIGSLDNLENNSSYTYLSLGLEKDLGSRFFIGAGYNIFATGATGGFPYFNVGVSF